jgi:CBS domain-containing protein
MPETTVADLMRTDVPTVTASDSVATVAKLLVLSGLPGVPVVDGTRVVGLVTESDLIARQADVDIPEPVAFFDAIVAIDVGRSLDDDLRRVLGTTVGDLMSHPVYNIKATATLDQLATLMVNEHVNPVPVLDDGLNLVGIVSRADLVKVIARLEGDDGTSQPSL